MQIHVVRSGQTLYGISQAYDVSVEAIAAANEIDPSLSLVVGQALVIPIAGQYYWVQPGDSLYTISRRFGIDANTLASVNALDPNRPLFIGLRLYIPPQPKRSVESNAYVEPREQVSESLREDTRKAAPLLTYLAPFSYQIQRDGTLSAPNLD